MYTADWGPLGKNIFYRKLELFSMNWNAQINLSDYIIASGKFGGPIALIRNNKKVVRVQGGEPTQVVHIYSAAGRLISSFKWNNGIFVDFGWSMDEDLVCIQENGMVIIYDMFGNSSKSFSFLQLEGINRDVRVLECRFFTSRSGTGLAILASNYKIHYVTNINDPRRKLAEIPGLDGPPTCWDVVIFQERELNFVVIHDTKIFILDAGERKCRTLSAECSSSLVVSPFQTPPSERKFSKGSTSSMASPSLVEFKDSINSIIAMAVSFNQQHIALLADNGSLWLGSSDLQRKYCEYDTKNKSRPNQLVWCGNGAVVGYWQNLLHLVGPDRDWLEFVLDSPSYLVPEMDGVRVISATTHELLQKVPSSVTDIFKIASIEPGALLLEASKEFRVKSPKADEYLRMLKEKNKLDVAVAQCIEAAGHELDPQTQKKLLRAASFGKCFIPDFSPDFFVSVCRKLRVLNAMRVHTIAIPLTFSQLEELTLPNLIDRLVRRRHFFLAIQICQYMGISAQEGSSKVLSQWALYKVENGRGKPVAELAREIAAKLGHAPGISYSRIAAHARDLGNSELAIKLLDYESRASEQVPLLAKLGQNQQAMAKAIESGDSDLVYFVMFEMGDPLINSDLFVMIRKMPIAYTLYLKYCRETDLERLQRTYYQNDNFSGQAYCHLLEGYATKIVEKQISCIKAAADDYKRAKQDFLASQAEDHMILLSHQLKLEAEFPSQEYVGLSLHATLALLLRSDHAKLAESLRREFKVPERRFFWLRLKIAAEKSDWKEVERLGKTKKSPIGYEPFVDICLAQNNKFEAQKYVAQVKTENKIKYMIKVGMLEDAARMAFAQKDEAALAKVFTACQTSNRVLAEKVSAMQAQLSGK